MTSVSGKLPPKVKNAAEFINELNKTRKTMLTKSDSMKLAEARMVLAVYSCRREHLLPTIANLTLILGQDAASTFKVVTPAYYAEYGIINEQ